MVDASRIKPLKNGANVVRFTFTNSANEFRYGDDGWNRVVVVVRVTHVVPDYKIKVPLLANAIRLDRRSGCFVNGGSQRLERLAAML